MHSIRKNRRLSILMRARLFIYFLSFCLFLLVYLNIGDLDVIIGLVALVGSGLFDAMYHVHPGCGPTKYRMLVVQPRLKYTY